ncbi:MAG: OmpA family protein [Rhodocyclaceae bacterium]|nr:OmpA family protein [Rhodocyclaceae bacterium]MDZ4214273.1 OmpA family protein [Rhodocyclaceae bacterium]
MTNNFTGKPAGLAVSHTLATLAVLSLGIVAGAASAQIDPATTGYLTDQRGVVAKSGHGLCWRTGYWTPQMAIAECDPDLMPKTVAAATPTPAPVAAPAPMTARVAERITLNAEALFDFDKAVLHPAGRTALDELVAKLKNVNADVIMVAGHADRFGTEAYNQLLSERRAEAVKSYLAGKGIEPNQIRTEGKGETQPVTKSGECAGPKNARVIACLQPDRRATIEVTGSQQK